MHPELAVRVLGESSLFTYGIKGTAFLREDPFVYSCKKKEGPLCFP